MNESLQRSSLSFSLRGLMVVTLVLAILFAAISPFLRTLNESQWWTLGIAVAAFFAGSLVTFAVFAALRYRVERKSGRPLLVLTHEIPPRFGRSYKVFRSLSPIFSSLPMLFITASSTWTMLSLAGRSGASTGVVWHWSILLLMLTSSATGGLLTFPIMTYGWTRERLVSGELCERGIIVGMFSFMPWKVIRVHHWSASAVVLVITPRKKFVTVPIASTQREKAREVIAERLAACASSTN